MIHDYIHCIGIADSTIPSKSTSIHSQVMKQTEWVVHKYVVVGIMLLCSLMDTVSAIQFGSSTNPKLFSSGMILQRGGAKVWGTGNNGMVTVTAKDVVSGKVLATSTSMEVDSPGWVATLNAGPAMNVVITAIDAAGQSASLTDVAIGDVLLCGGQSNSV